MIKTNIFALVIRLQKTSSGCFIYVFKTSARRLAKTTSKCFQDVFKTSCKNVFKTSSRRLQDILKPSLRHLQEVLPRRLQNDFKTSCKNVFKTSSRRLEKMSSRRFQDVSWNWTVLVSTSSIRIQHVFGMYYKDGYLQKNLPKSHFWEIYGQCTNFARVIKISKVLVFHFTTPFSGFLKRRI